jgi:hypothetical protein
MSSYQYPDNYSMNSMKPAQNTQYYQPAQNTQYYQPEKSTQHTENFQTMQYAPASVNWGVPNQVITTLVSQTPVGQHMFKPDPITQTDIHRGNTNPIVAQGNLIPGSNEMITASGNLKEPDVAHRKTSIYPEHPVLFTDQPSYSPSAVDTLPRNVNHSAQPITEHYFYPNEQMYSRLVPGIKEKTRVAGRYGEKGEVVEVDGIITHPDVLQTYKMQIPASAVNPLDAHPNHYNNNNSWMH